MKIQKISRIFAMAFLAFALPQFASAYYFNINHSCTDGLCVQGEKVTWMVNIFNDGNHNLEFVEIELVNAINHSTFASLEIPFYPYRDNRGNLIPVGIFQDKIVNITGVIPKANTDSELHIYYPCFTIAIYDFYTIARDDKYEQRQCFNENYTMPIFECLANRDCIGDEFCQFRKCQKLNCTSCQYILDHKCINYGCCETEQCSVTQACLNHTCIDIECEYSQYIFNHSCYNLDCRDDEKIFNRTCQKVQCLEEEYAFNHTCKKLGCKSDEFIYNHTCKKLNCNENEYFGEHICIPLECHEDQYVLNHACEDLECFFFQDEINHQCANNYDVITKLILEIIALAVILTFLLLDFDKYEKMHSKKKQAELPKKVEVISGEQLVIGKPATGESALKKAYGTAGRIFDKVLSVPRYILSKFKK